MASTTIPSTISNPVPETSEMDVDVVDEDLRKVVGRINQWLKHQNQMKKLPKTKHALFTATENLCSIQYKCCSVDKIYASLLSEGYLQVGKDEKVKYLKPTTHVMRRNFGGHLSDEEWGLERCRVWVFADGNSPGTVSALKNCLDQLLLKKTQVDQRSVFNYFEQKGKLAFDDNDNVSYVL